MCDRDGPGRPSYDLGIGQSSRSTDICLQQTWADPDRPNRLLYNTRTSGKPPYQWKYGTHRREFLPSKGSAGRSKIHRYKNISLNEAIEGRLREQMSSEVRNPLSSLYTLATQVPLDSSTKNFSSIATKRNPETSNIVGSASSHSCLPCRRSASENSFGGRLLIAPLMADISFGSFSEN